MNILYASTVYPPAIGGAQMHLHRLIGEMQRAGHSPRVVTHTSRYRRDWVRLSTVCCEPRLDYLYEGVPISRLGFSPGRRLRMLPWAAAYYGCMGGAARRLSRLIGDELAPLAGQPALVHATRIGREFLARAACEFAHRQSIPFVLTPNHHPRWRGWLYREYDRLYRQADAVLALTSAEKDLLVREKSVAPERIHVTGVGPILADEFCGEAFRRRFGITGRFVLYVGQQLRYKGLAAVVEAAQAVWQHHGDVRFVFIGPPTRYSRRLFERVHDRRLLNLGSVDLSTKTSALAACELLCLPSLQESFGGVFVEAWSHRKAVIGGRIAQVASVIDDGVDGLLVNQNAGELSAAICRLLSDADECQAMGEAGWRKVQQRYTWRQIAASTREAYVAAGATLDTQGVSEPMVCQAGAGDSRDPWGAER
ncbi:MAG TPA: glycosyltransferase family 4 protein [Pirellulales bacterium]|nr:glycosyltransferase family 4 protein [Pirellulales bacterium]